MSAQKVVLLFGGVSEERLVSTASAQNFIRFLPDCEAWFINPEGKVFLVSTEELSAHQAPFKNLLQPKGPALAEKLVDLKSTLKSRVVLISLHGTEGEDGHLQKFFEDHLIPYTGSGAAASAVCFDKIAAKKLAQKNDFPLAEQLELPALNRKVKSLSQIELDTNQFLKLKQKIVIKPVANGSSFGLHIIQNPEQLKQALLDIQKNADWNYMAEEFVTGRELTVGVLKINGQLRALPPSEVILESGHQFDYEGKYLGRGTKEVTPAQLSPEQTLRAQELALKAHRLFNCYGYSRTDMIQTNQGPYFLETNTLPGMTKASFFPQQLEAAQISFQSFIQEMLTQAQQRFT